MTDKNPPKTKLELHPSEDIWTAVARELARNPDSPTSLKFMSAMKQAMAPRTQAVEQVVDALEARILLDGEQTRAAVQAAIQHWEKECGEQMESSVLEDLKKSARKRIEHNQRQPPALESILANSPETPDAGYRLGLHLEGIQGTWHRLWGLICLVFSFDADPGKDDGVATIRSQFEGLLGRTMSVQEWDALVAHAKNHYETVMKPLLGGGGGG